jgi:hypothetical protein
MSSSDYRQVTTIAQRLGRLLNPVALAGTIGEVITAISTPPPGDPDALESLAAAHRTAAAAARPIVADAERAFTDAAAALVELASVVREQQGRHAELHKALRAAAHDATHVGAVPMPDPTALDDILRVVTALHAVYTDSLAAADRAASRFADIAGRARAAAAVAGGLDPAEAVTLARQLVSVPGIGDAYDDGVLSIAQLRAAGPSRDRLGDADRVTFAGLLDRAGSEAERAWLYKGLTAGHPVTELSGFADTIRGRQPSWLDAHLSLVDRGGAGNQSRLDVDIRQYEPNTCGTTCLIVARAEADPLYVLSLTDGNLAANFTAERVRVLDQTNVLWPKGFGTSPEGMADHISTHTGVRYRWHLVDDTDQRRISSVLREVVTAADRGHPVPVLVGGAVPRHYVLVVGHSGGDVLIYEPTGGQTIRVGEPDFLDGNLASTAGFDHVQAVVLPELPELPGAATGRG